MASCKCSAEFCFAAGVMLLLSACAANGPPASKDSLNLTRAELFDLRTKCSDLARRVEQETRNEKKAFRILAGDIDSFTNRYDPTANRCYVEQFTAHSQTANNGEFQEWLVRSVMDAQENVVLVSCNDYIHGSVSHQTTCTGTNAKTITVDEGNAQMNSLMEESIKWP